MAKDLQKIKEIFNGHYLEKREIFYFFSVSFVVFAILEMIWPNIILAYFNLNILFVLWLISGLVLISQKDSKK